MDTHLGPGSDHGADDLFIHRFLGTPYHVEPEEVLVVERVAGDTRFLGASDLPLVKANAGASPTGAMYLAGYLDTRGAGAK